MSLSVVYPDQIFLPGNGNRQTESTKERSTLTDASVKSSRLYCTPGNTYPGYLMPAMEETVAGKQHTYSHIGGELLKGLANLRQDGFCTDFEVIVQGQRFRCHKVILAAMSDFFKAMFQSGMKETVKNQAVIDNVTPETFQLILDLMHYKDEDPDPLGYKHDDQKLKDLIMAADMFQMSFLHKLCLKRMSCTMNDTNCVQRWKMCNALPCPDIAQVAFVYIVNNFNIEKVQDCVITLDYENFFPIISSPSLEVDKEFDKWLLISKWIDKNQQEERFPELLECCSLTEIDRTTLMEKIAFDKRIRHSDAASKLVQNAIKYQNHPGDHGNMDLKFPKSAQKEQYCVSFVVENEKDFYLSMYTASLRNNKSNFSSTSLPMLKEFACCVHACNIYLCGGKNERSLSTSECSLYKLGSLSRNQKIVELKKMPMKLKRHAMVATDSSLFVVGGNKAGNLRSDVMKYAISSNQWSFHGKVLTPVENASALHVNNSIYIIGGVVNSEEPGLGSDIIQRYDINTSTATILAGRLPSPCAFSSTIVKQDQVLVVTGNGEIVRLSETFEPELVATIPDFGKRKYFGVHLDETTIKIYGGFKGDEGSDVYDKEVITFDMNDGTMAKASRDGDVELLYFGNLRVVAESSLLS